MDRAFKSGASATPPTAPASPSIGYASQGDAGSGVPPTKPGPYWFHMVTEELRNIVVAGGLTPSQATVNQVLTALQAMFAANGRPGHTYTANDWTPLGGGLILQWGQMADGVAEATDLVLPVAFSSAIYAVVPVINASLSSSQSVSAYWDKSLSTLSTIRVGRRFANNGGSVALATQGFTYLAIGR